MKTAKILATFAAVVLLSGLSARAQSLKFLMSFQGIVVSNNAAGNFVAPVINGRSWLADYAKSAGLPNINSLALVYHFAADARGDIIEIIDKNSGTVLDTPFLLFFGQDQSLGRSALTNGNGTRVRIIQYVYTHQNSHSMGAALLGQQLSFDSSGNIANVSISGPMDYVVNADGAHLEAVVNGTLVTGKRVSFPGVP